jgi:hypothetical protein
MAFIKFDNKDPRECLDYTVEFTDLLPAGTQLVSAQCTIEAVDPAEPSPNSELELDFIGSPQCEVVSSGATSPSINDQVLIWLKDGRLGAKYTLRIDAIDSEAVPGPRCYTRRATIKIASK